MATTTGLPTLSISFKAAAQEAANRAKKGTAAVIVRDSKAQGVHPMNSAALIPEELGTANQEYIRSAFTGSDRGAPSLVIALVIAPGTETTEALEEGLKLISAYGIDYIAAPSDATAAELAALNTWVKAQRALYRTVKLVRPFAATGSDDMGIIELEETGAYAGTKSVSAAYLCGRIAGILAGTGMGQSCTYAALPELTEVAARSVSEQEAAIKAGKLILVHDGRQAKIARGVNSLTTIPSDGKADWCKIKIVEGMDIITYFLRTTIENSYIGRYANTYDNKQLLITAVSDYLLYLESAGVLTAGESYAEIDYSAQLRWLNSQGVDTSAMDRQAILEYQTGSWVFLRCGGRLVDAMEDFEINFSNL
ncbi:MAG: phage tail sheath subtilisin-like domain-containing protein [Candidatus Heteroscillospira sp.]